MEVFAGKLGELGWSLMALSGTTTWWQLFRAGSGSRLQCQWGGTVQTCLGLVCQEALGRRGGGTPVGALLDAGIVIAAIEGIEKLHGKDVCDPKPLLSLSFFCTFVGMDSCGWVGDGERRAFCCHQNGSDGRCKSPPPSGGFIAYSVMVPDLTKQNTAQDETRGSGWGLGHHQPPLAAGGYTRGSGQGDISHCCPWGGRKGGSGGLFCLERSPGETSGKEIKKSKFPSCPSALDKLKLNPSSRHFWECLGMGIAWKCAALVSASQGS